MMPHNKQDVLDMLKDDKEYYGDFGKQFLSNSDIYSLLNNPAEFRKGSESSIPFVVGGYFHTLVLEPDKLEKYKVIDASTRSTKVYKELSEGEICLLQKEVDMIEGWRDRVLGIDFMKNLIRGNNVEYEVPAVGELEGFDWKGKADIVNHDEGLIIDLKTTGELSSFHRSAYKYNYDSQAYIYQKLFGYPLVFIAIDKKTGQVGFFECSQKFLTSGANKVAKAAMVYSDWKDNPEKYATQHFIEATL